MFRGDRLEIKCGLERRERKRVAEGKRSKWGPVLAERRSLRIQNDGRISLKKAKDNKKKEDLEEVYNKGKRKKPIKNNSSKNLLSVASSLGVDMGKDELDVEENLELCTRFDKERKARGGEGGGG
jgi:hypothetical protein